MTVAPLDTTATRRPQPSRDLAPHDEAPWLTIVLPAHNEAEHIGAVAVSFLLAAERTGRSVEVLVIDDGSTDGTLDALRATPGGDDPRIRAVRRERCGGYGKALVSGFHHARGHWVFFTDADGQFDPNELPDFLAALDGDGPQLVAGYRSPRRDNLPRRLLGRAWTLLVRTVLRVQSRDVNCAFKVMRRADLDAMGLISSGAMINAELLHKARRLGVTVHERPVTHLPRLSGEQSGARPDVMARALYELARYRVETAQRAPRR